MVGEGTPGPKTTRRSRPGLGGPTTFDPALSHPPVIREYRRVVGEGGPSHGGNRDGRGTVPGHPRPGNRGTGRVTDSGTTATRIVVGSPDPSLIPVTTVSPEPRPPDQD